MSHKYEFIGAVPLHFMDLSYGPGVEVIRKDVDEADVSSTDPVFADLLEGQTVTLQLGDVLIVDEPVVHSQLVEDLPEEGEPKKKRRTPAEKAADDAAEKQAADEQAAADAAATFDPTITSATSGDVTPTEGD